MWLTLAGGCSASCQSLGRARRDMFQDSCGGKPFPARTVPTLMRCPTPCAEQT